MNNERVLVRQILSLASMEDESRRRDEVEREPSLEKVIPLFVFNYQDRSLLITNPISGEGKRQGRLYSLGVKGHLQEENLDEDLSS